jgi:biopolymer transport protein TolR
MRRFSGRRRTKRNTAITDVSLTPLIDTALTLLVIFMVASPMMHNAIKVSLPKGKAKEDLGVSQDLEIYIDKGGAISFEGKQYTAGQVIEVLQKKVGPDTGRNAEKTVYVKADTAVSYGKVIELVDQIKVVGGIKYVALATQKYA